MKNEFLLKNESVKDYLDRHSKIIIPKINNDLSIIGLDISKLPYDFQYKFIEWLFVTQRRRLEQRLPLILTFDVVKLCPLWKIIKMPIIKMKLTKEDASRKLNKKISSEKEKIKTINKS